MNKRERIMAAIQHAVANGIKKTAIADFCQVSRTAVSQWSKGDVEELKYTNLRNLAKVCQVSEPWLAEGKGAMVEGAADTRAEYQVKTNVLDTPQPIRYHRYPVISRVQAGNWTECVTPYEPGGEPHEEATDYRAQGKAFWLEVQGDSMTAPTGSRPSIPEGTLVLFDTGLEAAPGKLVAALLADSNEATFKQLIEDSGQRYLKALNPAYPLIPINGNCRILGVAVEAKTRL